MKKKICLLVIIGLATLLIFGCSAKQTAPPAQQKASQTKNSIKDNPEYQGKVVLYVPQDAKKAITQDASANNYVFYTLKSTPITKIEELTEIIYCSGDFSDLDKIPSWESSFDIAKKLKESKAAPNLASLRQFATLTKAGTTTNPYISLKNNYEDINLTHEILIYDKYKSQQLPLLTRCFNEMNQTKILLIKKDLEKAQKDKLQEVVFVEK